MLTAYCQHAMRRADRLFQILQILRRSRGPTTAERLAEELEVSKRTVYRDIADLIAQRTPIAGEAGVGYVLGRDYDMPPLMLTGDELEAAALGAQWVAGLGDAALARAARDLLAKIEAVTPERLRAFVGEPSVAPAPPLPQAADGLDLARAREWIRKGRKIRLRYGDATNRDLAARGLAGAGRLCGGDADARSLVRAACGFPPFPRRPDSRGGVLGGALSRAARRSCAPAGRRRGRPSAPRGSVCRKEIGEIELKARRIEPQRAGGEYPGLDQPAFSPLVMHDGAALRIEQR